jgi:hypothetical protein
MVAKVLKDVIEQAETWPQQDQEELAEYAHEIQARRTGVYIMSDEERAAVHRGLAQADRGEFALDDVVGEADKRHDLWGSGALLKLLLIPTGTLAERRALTFSNIGASLNRTNASPKNFTVID